MKLKIKKFNLADTVDAANLIRQTYKRFCNNEGDKEATKNYIDRYDFQKNKLSELQNRFKKTKIFYIASLNDKIIGLVRGEKNRLFNLFVNGKYHRKGIGTKLVVKFEQEAKKYAAHEIKIRSSLHASPFYQKIGYKKTTGIRNMKGLKIQPLKKSIIKTTYL